MELGNLDVRIEITLDMISQIEELVKLADEIRKEYSCNCTLVLKGH